MRRAFNSSQQLFRLLGAEDEVFKSPSSDALVKSAHENNGTARFQDRPRQTHRSRRAVQPLIQRDVAGKAASYDRHICLLLDRDATHPIEELYGFPMSFDLIAAN